jgi:predicted phage terminase large subunit-like protein
MQSPRPTEGSLFKRKWIQYYKVRPGRFDEILQSWDCTFKDTKDSDFVVGQVWGRVGAFYYLLDQTRGQMDFPATIAAIESLTAKWPAAHTKLVEDKANGSAVISVLRKKITGLIPVNPEGGKEARAAAVSPSFESGNVFLPDPTLCPWIHDYIEELVSFPQGKNDDQVDSTTQALIRMVNPFEPLIGRA